MPDPANPVLFMTDDEIRARLAEIYAWEWTDLLELSVGEIKEARQHRVSWDAINFLLNVIDARLPSLTERERADDEARRE